MTTPHPSGGKELPAGTRLEEFVIERVLGSGGFGITYLARDVSLNRPVVIKENLPGQFAHRNSASLTVHPGPGREDQENFRWSLDNFSREAEMLASLRHPGIVAVLRRFEAFGTAYFVMPFVEGVPFDQLIEQRLSANKPFTGEELRGLLERVLDALDYLHQRGIYHRDIKPANILITNEGVPVLIDFGSARQRLSERSMTVVESAGYTPFEQLQSRGNVGPWSDLYALAGTLVKAIAGETPPKANDRVFDDPWQGLATRTGLSVGFSPTLLASIDRALALHPRDRWQHAGEWSTALASKDLKSQTQPPPSIFRTVDDTRTPELVTKPPNAPVAPRHQPGEERDFDLSEGCIIRMCWIPPGEFLMGSPEEEPGRRNDEERHLVRITRGYWMGKYPVTQEQWLAVMGTHPNKLEKIDMRTRLNSQVYNDHLAKWARHPIECVCWDEICGYEEHEGSFLQAANSHSPDDMKFDLPAEAEWEYACRTGKSAPHDNHLDSYAWYFNNSNGRTHPVGQKMANTWGLHDMQGNVWEWCSDRYAAYPPGPVTDHGKPHSARTPDDHGICRVFRGGSWANDALLCRMACRNYNYSSLSNDCTGFRLVCRDIV